MDRHAVAADPATDGRMVRITGDRVPLHGSAGTVLSHASGPLPKGRFSPELVVAAVENITSPEQMSPHREYALRFDTSKTR